MSVWGIIPAAGVDSRVQHPRAFAPELLPLGRRPDDDRPSPRVVSEYIVERMIAGGARKLCFVIPPGRSPLLEYFGGRIGDVDIVYVIQPHPVGLCDALFRARVVVGRDEQVLIGFPDTLWFPMEGFALIPEGRLSLLLFSVAEPQRFETVVTDEHDVICEVRAKHAHLPSNWTWGAAKMPGAIFHALHDLWRERACTDAALGPLLNAYLARGGPACAVRSGFAYADVGMPSGYEHAMRMLAGSDAGLSSDLRAASTPYTDGWRPLTAARYAQAFPELRVEADPLQRSAR